MQLHVRQRDAKLRKVRVTSSSVHAMSLVSGEAVLWCMGADRERARARRGEYVVGHARVERSVGAGWGT